MDRKIVAVITSCLGYEVLIGERALNKTFEHVNMFANPLELLERVLKNPSRIFLERESATRHYHLYYRKELDRYFVAIVKRIPTGLFLRTMHTSGKRIRNKHLGMERLL